MPNPKDPTLQDKLRQWVENNPDRWYTAKYKEIHIETGVSFPTLYRYYPLIVARVAGILPSVVKAKRDEHFGDRPWPWELSDEEIAEIQQLFDEGQSRLDISWMTGHSLAMVEKYRPKENKPRPPATQDTE